MPVEEQIKEIEEEIRKTPYNKASQHHIGKLKAKLAKLRTQAVKSEGIGKAQALGYGLRKSGDATVILVGFPSVGKSTLINQLTNAESKIAAYEFTTLQVIPGALKYEGIDMQILDVPGLVEGAASGKGRGKEVISVIRIADLIVMLVDSTKPDQLEKMKKELYEAGFRLNEKPPEVKINKKSYGGIVVQKTNDVKVSVDEIKSILSEFNILNADVLVRGKVDVEKFIDAVIGNRIYIPMLAVFNKTDIKKPPKIKDSISISALEGKGIEELKKKMFEKLGLIRLYMKPQGKEADFVEPLITKKGSTLEDVCLQIHKAFRDKFRYAQIWGKSAKHEGQKVGLTHVVKDKDIVSIILKE